MIFTFEITEDNLTKYIAALDSKIKDLQAIKTNLAQTIKLVPERYLHNDKIISSELIKLINTSEGIRAVIGELYELQT